MRTQLRGSTATDATGQHRLPANLLRVGTALLGLCLAGVLVLDGSRAAFSDTTTNGGNSVGTGDVVLDDDDASTKMFNLGGLNGGQTVERCINVTYTGSLTADVKLHGVVGGTGLAPGLDTTIEIGTGATGGNTFDCSGFTGATELYDDTLTAFGTDHTDFSSGLGGFTNATDPATKSYKVSVTVSNDSAYQAKTATVDFTWEAQGQDG